MRKLILRNFQSPGDVVILTAAVRDLHLSYPGEFTTDVRTACDALWAHNPHLTPLSDTDSEVTQIDCEYPLIHHSNHRPYHFIHGFIDDLNRKLGLNIQPTAFKGDIHLTREEKGWMSQVQEITREAVPFWIIVAGGKTDFTIKWWDSARWQQVVDHFRGRILFVQVGEARHVHPPLDGVLDLRGRTNLRQLVRLVYHAQGVVCPVTAMMHLAAAVEVKGGRPKNRPCVVVAGGREPAQWEAYPHHQYIHTNGALMCCDNGGCWMSRTVPLGDGDEKDEKLCMDVVDLESGQSQAGKDWGQQVNGHSRRLLPRCMEMITHEEVIRRIETYFHGGTARFLTASEREIADRAVAGQMNAIATPKSEVIAGNKKSTRISVLVGCYGAWPQYSIRAVESVFNHCNRRDAIDVYVGCNESSPAILAALRNHLDEERIDALIESRRNMNKDPMMRLLLDMCDTDYALWMDDDSHVLPGWDEHLLRFIEANQPFDVAGHVHFIQERSLELASFLKARPWYKSAEMEREPILFPLGGLFLVRVDWLRKHQFPDRAMIKKLDDVLLGEMVSQQNGIMRDFGKDRELMARLRIDDGTRRGTGEGSDGWVVAGALNGHGL